MLTGATNEEKIWNYLVGKGLSKAGAAGLMGNLNAESALNPKNLQNSYERTLGYTDDSYTAAVDSGSYATSSTTARATASHSGRIGAGNKICWRLHGRQASPSGTWRCSSIFYTRSFRRGTGGC